MSWVFFAFCGPVLWAISVHFDKYLIERFFKRSNVAVLLVFSALMGLAMLPLIAMFRPDVIGLAPLSILVIVLSGLLLMVAMFFYLVALQSDDLSEPGALVRLGHVVIAVLPLGHDLGQMGWR